MVTGYTPPPTTTEPLSEQRLYSLYQIIQRMNAAHELPDLLAFILDRALQDTGGRRGYLLLAGEPTADGSEPPLEVKAARDEAGDMPRAEGDILGFVSRTVVRDVLRRGEPRVIEDLRQDVRYTGRTSQPSAQHKWQSILAIPLKVADRLIGLMYIEHPGRNAFPDPDLEFLSAFSTSATVAIENARLFAAARQADELRALNEVGSALTSSLDVQRVLQIIMQGLTSLIRVERVSVFLINQLTGELVLEYSLGGHEDIRLRAPWPGIVGWIALHGMPVIANDVRHDPRFLPDIDAATHFATRSILGAPLKLDERVIGVVEMLNKLDNSFTPRDRDLLVDFSKWAAIALYNARLYEELEEAKERLANAEAVAVIGDMALNLTHELNNRISIVPLTLGRIQAKCKDELGNPYLQQKLGVIGRVVEESNAIIRRIREPFEMSDEGPVSVTDCLAEALNSSPVKPGIKVVERYQPDLPPVVAARDKLVQALRHTISNALEAMGERGQLWLSTRRRTDGLVEAVISDDGPGIPPEIMKDIFKMGITTKKDKGGLGLGLWWTHAYVSRLGGQIKLHSTPDGGTVVSVRLPPAAQEPS